MIQCELILFPWVRSHCETQCTTLAEMLFSINMEIMTPNVVAWYEISWEIT